MNPICLLATVTVLAILLPDTEGALKPGECEVCVKFIGKFEKTLTEEDRKDQNEITKKLKKMCKKAKGKDNRFCYYVGGTEIAATYILQEITKPLASFFAS